METDTRAFGPYEIVRRLGVGGMAETFLALRRGLHGVEQRVCLKRVLPAFAADPSFLRQFEREASIASTLRFTGIVSVVEFGDVEGAKYLALELVDGVDLRDFLASRPGRVLDPPTVGRLALDLGYALRYAHQPGRDVVHRDVSPANVMLSRTGEVKLTDFGVARVMSSAAPTTSTGVRGKIAYMSPEQLRGEELDGRADLFALGVLLFECLCGQRPFHGAHDVEIMRRIGAGERPHVRDLAPASSPPVLLAAIEGLLATDRAERTPDATALIEQLSSLPGLHQARRRLAAQVDELRGGVHTREHVTEEREERSDTRLDSVPAAALPRGAAHAAGAVAAGIRSAGLVDGTVADVTGATVVARPAGALDAGAASAADRAPGGELASAPVLVAAPRTRPARAAWFAASVAALVALVAVLWTWLELGPAPTTAGLAPEASGARSVMAAEPGAGATPTPPATGTAVAVSAVPATADQVAPAARADALASSARAAHSDGPAPVAPVAPAPATATRAVAAAAAVPPAAAPPAAPPAAASAPADPTPAAAASAQGAPHPAADEPPAPAAEVVDDARPGTLRVTVIPWGDVWVDGRYMGRAPTEVSLRPGRHVVAAGTDRPAQRRSVQVSAGQLRRVELELDP